MAERLRKFFLFNIITGTVVIGSYSGFSYYREAKYKRQFMTLKNKAGYLRAMHSMSGPKLDKLVQHETEMAGNLRAKLVGEAHGRVLEVAIGTAPNLQHYADDVDLIGLDWSPRMLEIARTKDKGKVRSLRLLESDISKLPYDSDSFDAVVCTFGLCSVLRPADVLAEMRRVVKPQGLIILMEHGIADTWSENFKLSLVHYRDLCTTGCNNTQDVDKLVLSSGMHILQRWREDKGRLYAYTLRPNKG